MFNKKTKNYRKTKLESYLTGVIFSLIFLSGFLAWGNAMAACTWDSNVGTSSDATQESVQACIDYITSAMSGEVTINIPADTKDWSTYVYLNMNDISGVGDMTNVTTLNIIGAGVGQTVITDTGTDTTFNLARLFHINTKAGKRVRLSGMTIKNGTTTAAASGSGLVYVYGDGTSTILANLDFPDIWKTTGVSIHQGTGLEGVLHSCTFTVMADTPSVQWNAIKVYGGETNAAPGSGDAEWTGQAFTPGTEHAWYIENNVFTFYPHAGNGCWDAYNGSRIVHRYNDNHGCGIGGHGNDSGNYAAVHTTEVYNNLFDMQCGEVACYSGGTAYNMVEWRGGTGVMFDNKFGERINPPSRVINYRSNPYYEGTAANTDNSSTTLQDPTANFGPNVMSNTPTVYNQTKRASCRVTSYTSTTITCSTGLSGGAIWESGDKYQQVYFYNDDLMCDGLAIGIDGNVEGQQGWPCKQQVGTTYDTGTSAYVPKPIYAWGNVHNGTTGGKLTVYSDGSQRMKDYHVIDGLTFFNCDSAADCKTDTDNTNMPGFGYNQGWTYSPYRCPHPLVDPLEQGSCSTTGETMYGTAGYTLTSGESDTTPPAAPSGLSVS